MLLGIEAVISDCLFDLLQIASRLFKHGHARGYASGILNKALATARKSCRRDFRLWCLCRHIDVKRFLELVEATEAGEISAHGEV